MNDLERAAADPRPTWTDARAKVWRRLDSRPDHAHQLGSGWIHDDPAGACTSATTTHRTYSTAVLCERASQMIAWRRRAKAARA